MVFALISEISRIPVNRRPIPRVCSRAYVSLSRRLSIHRSKSGLGWSFWEGQGFCPLSFHLQGILKASVTPFATTRYMRSAVAQQSLDHYTEVSQCADLYSSVALRRKSRARSNIHPPTRTRQFHNLNQTIRILGGFPFYRIVIDKLDPPRHFCRTKGAVA